MELIKDAPECDEFASEVEDSNGLYFVPAFTGLGAPYWDMYARGCMRNALNILHTRKLGTFTVNTA